MEFGRREILSGFMATLGTAAWAAPKEEKAMYGMIGKMTATTGKRAEVIPLLLQAVRRCLGA